MERDTEERIIYGFTFEIDVKAACDKVVQRSVRRWASTKKSEYRNYCPFILKHACCDDICGRMIRSHAIPEKSCMFKHLSSEMIFRVIEEIIKIGTKNNPTNKSDVEWANEVIDEEIIIDL